MSKTQPPPDRQTATQRTIAEMKRMVASSRWAPGERLPGERHLAEEFQVSRSTIREAIGAMTAMGIVEARHGAGIYLTQLQAHDLLESLEVATEIWQDQDILHLLEVRRILEASATSSATARMADGELVRLRELVTQMDHLGPGEDFVSADTEFHRLIVGAGGNPVISAVLERMSTRTFRARVMRSRADDVTLQRTREEHHRILAALADRDPQRAAIAAAAHVTGVEHWLKSIVEEVAPAGEEPGSPGGH
jgi:GntR family transcriptional regulator, transcriptional repressor for pyruvate dehydrogenase complex